MATRKKTTKRKTSSSKRKTTASRRRSSPARRKTGGTRKKPTGRSQRSSTKGASTKAAPPIRPGISPDRKLEIVGIIFSLAGLLTFLSLASSSRSEATSFWVNFWRTTFGWGAYILPLAMIGVGVWMVVRNFERVPQLSIERLIGISFMILIMQVFLHLWASPAGREAAYAVAAEGQGGGYIGAALMVFLESGLGTLGMLIGLGAWVVISLAMSLDVSVVDLFKWVPPLVLRIQDAWDERQAGSRAGDVALSTEKPPGFIPMPEPPPVILETQPPSPLDESPPPESLAETSPSAAPYAVPEKRDWLLPALPEMLDEGAEVTFNDEYDRQRAKLIEDTLASFGAPASVIEINRGPTITQYGVEPDFIESRGGRTRVRVGKIAALADDLSLALAASRIRIQAPVPGKGYVGIEVPNEQIAVVALRDVVENEAFTRLKSPLRFALGQDVAGNAVAANMTGMPHLLVAGATGSGKSVFVNALIACLLLHNTPETLRFIMVDPKRVELTGYNGVPHLMAPVVTEIDRIVGVLQWVTREMDSRYQKFADIGSRNIEDYNARMTAQGAQTLPFLVLVIDELADMMMVAPDQTERHITRMAQLARATGIHLVISTQRPSVDVVTGLIKANFPARISFAVASGTDSRVVLDQPGAERLLGRGDMLFQAPDAAAPVRLQGVFVSETELLRIVQYWRGFSGTAPMAPIATSTPVDAPPAHVPLKQIPIWEEMKEEEEQDNIYTEAVELVRRQGRASISMLQRRLRIGYTRAARLIDVMEDKGIIGPAQSGAQAREVLDYGQGAPPVGED